MFMRDSALHVIAIRACKKVNASVVVENSHKVNHACWKCELLSRDYG